NRATAESQWSRRRSKGSGAVTLRAVCPMLSVMVCTFANEILCHAMPCYVLLVRARCSHHLERSRSMLAHEVFFRVKLFRACGVMISPPSPKTGDSHQKPDLFAQLRNKPSPRGYNAIIHRL